MPRVRSLPLCSAFNQSARCVRSIERSIQRINKRFCRYLLVILATVIALVGVTPLQAQSGSLPTLRQLQRQGNSSLPALSYALTASLRLGIARTDDIDNSGDFSLEDYESRIGWRAQTPLAAGIAADGYVEIGLESANSDFNEDDVALNLRQLWAGVSGAFGSLRLGRQYDSFYEYISAPTDSAEFGSCWTQLFCSRQSRVIKFTTPDAPLVIGVSLVASPDDAGNDAADQIQFGFSYRSGSLYFGFAGARVADEGAADEGNVFGLAFSFGFGDGSIAISYQDADDGVALPTGMPFSSAAVESTPGGLPETTNLTLAFRYGPGYFIANRGEMGNTEPEWITFGASHNLGQTSALFYELQQVDRDDGTDEDNFLRLGFRYDF